MSKAFIADVIQKLSRDHRRCREPRRRGSDRGDRQGDQKVRWLHAAELWHLYGQEDQGAQGRESADRRGDQGEGRQNGALQSSAEPEGRRLRASGRSEGRVTSRLPPFLKYQKLGPNS